MCTAKTATPGGCYNAQEFKVMTVFIRKQIRLFTAIGCVLLLTHLAAAAPDTASIKTEIVGMPLGISIELRLKDKHKLRGARGALSESGFTLVDARSRERQIAFDDVVSVKQLKSHTKRNILIAVAVGVAAVTVVLVIVGVRSRISGY